MSVVDTPGVDDGIYRTTFDPATEPVTVAVLEALNAAAVSVCPDVVLADSIDPDTLEQLYRETSPDSWMLTFDHDGVEITLWGSGRIHIDPTGEVVPSEAEGQSTAVANRPAGLSMHPSGPTL